LLIFCGTLSKKLAAARRRSSKMLKNNSETAPVLGPEL